MIFDYSNWRWRTFKWYLQMISLNVQFNVGNKEEQSDSLQDGKMTRTGKMQLFLLLNYINTMRCHYHNKRFVTSDIWHIMYQEDGL